MSLALSRRLMILVSFAIALGLVLSAYWFLRLDLATLAQRLREGNPGWIALIVSGVLAALGVRMLRWHFFLRNSGFMVRPRDSARIFLAALIMIMTPGYVGELIKAYWLRHGYGIAMRNSIPLIFFERFFDVLALATLYLAVRWFSAWQTVAALFAITLLLGAGWHYFCPFAVHAASFFGRIRLLLFLRHSAQETPPDIRQLRRPYFFAISFTLSLIAWLPGALALKLALLALGQDLAIGDSIRIFCGGTLIGGISLMPGGIAVAGSWFIRELQAGGFALSDAILGAALLRFLTVWFAFGIGLLTYAFFRRRHESIENLDRELHFDRISVAYDAQIPPHVRDLLIARKTGRMMPRLDDLSGSQKGMLGLDVGCGLGWYADRMTRAGYPTIGIDLSLQQSRQAAEREVPVAVAEAVSLPFPDESFDFAYSINVLHHLPSREAQQRAFAEIARLLKPGGLFFLHEINVHNPLFRFYIGYLFPIIKNIDEGTEFWIRPRDLARTDEFFLPRQVDYFTFLPDFAPKILLKPLAAIERFLEASPARKWSAHYMLTLEKRAAPGQ